jgi:hypothetical protein
MFTLTRRSTRPVSIAGAAFSHTTARNATPEAAKIPDLPVRHIVVCEPVELAVGGYPCHPGQPGWVDGCEARLLVARAPGRGLTSALIWPLAGQLD